MSAEPKPLAASPAPGESAVPSAPTTPPAAPVKRDRWKKMPRWKKAVGIAFVGAVAGLSAWASGLTSEPKDDPGRFQGRWFLAVPATDRDGKPAVRAVTGVTIRISGDRLVWMVGEQEQKRYAITLRPEGNPKEIDLTQLKADDTPLIQRFPPPERPVMLRGIYTIDGNRAKVVTSIDDEARPTDIDATDGVTVWLLERVN
jgi:uncharacterized protein (TIGR03067 family)